MEGRGLAFGTCASLVRGRELLCLFEKKNSTCVGACDSVEVVGVGGLKLISTLFSTKNCRAVIEILKLVLFFVMKIQVVSVTQVQHRLSLYVPPFLLTFRVVPDGKKNGGCPLTAPGNIWRFSATCKHLFGVFLFQHTMNFPSCRSSMPSVIALE